MYRSIWCRYAFLVFRLYPLNLSSFFTASTASAIWAWFDTCLSNFCSKGTCKLESKWINGSSLCLLFSSGTAVQGPNSKAKKLYPHSELMELLHNLLKECNSCPLLKGCIRTSLIQAYLFDFQKNPTLQFLLCRRPPLGIPRGKQILTEMWWRERSKGNEGLGPLETAQCLIDLLLERLVAPHKLACLLKVKKGLFPPP